MKDKVHVSLMFLQIAEYLTRVLKSDLISSTLTNPLLNLHLTINFQQKSLK